jgi:phospholipid/cholesterol/gamma-HCH transport system substrate-binding protein
MEPQARYVWVGALVLAVVALLVASFLWLLASGQHRDERTYRIYFTRQSLEGLQARSDVRMKGIRVGDVTAFAFSAQHPGTVEVLVSLERQTPVRESTRAVVDRNLITGLASIRLLNASEDSPLLKQAPPGESEPVIGEGASQLQQVSDSLNQLATRADETMQRIDSVLSDANQTAFAETLENMRRLTRDVGGVVGRLDQTLASVGRAADGLHALEGSLGANAEVLTRRYDALGAQATESMREVADSMRQVSGNLSELTSRSEVVLLDNDIRLRTTTRQVESAARSFGETSRHLADPRSALFGPPAAGLGPGEDKR